MKCLGFLLHVAKISMVGQQEIALTEDRNSGESQNFLKCRVIRIIINIHVGQIANYYNYSCRENRKIMSTKS